MKKERSVLLQKEKGERRFLPTAAELESECLPLISNVLEDFCRTITSLKSISSYEACKCVRCNHTYPAIK